MSNFYIPLRRMAYQTIGVVDHALNLKQPLVFILCYHSISNSSWNFSVSPITFKKQIRYLAKSRNFVTLKDVEDHITGKRQITKPSVLISFDDGYKDILSIKNYLFKKRISPTLFVLSDPKNASRKELDNNKPFLSKKQIKTLIKSGWTIGSHTARHKDLTLLNGEGIKKEITDSKKKLEKVLNIKIKYIAYPKGKYNQSVLNGVKNAKYKLGLSMDDGVIGRKTDLLRIPRIGIDGTHSFSEFQVIYLPTVSLLRGLLKRFI